MTGIEFYCDVCEKRVWHHEPHTTGYAVLDCDEKACYACCADIDRKEMDETVAALDRGEKVKAICLYLADKDDEWRATNLPGTLTFKCHSGSHQRQKAFGQWIFRHDVWFTDHNGREWHGVNKGDNQILRCKPLKKRSK